MPYSYTNRHGKTYYIRAVETKTGKYRYYLTTSDAYPNLIEFVPEGFEVVEHPEDAKVVIRRQKKIHTTPEEKELLKDIIEEFSGIKDFFIHAEESCLFVYHSQFNYVAGQEPNLTREEAFEVWGGNIEKWMRFFCSLRFILVDKEERLFQAEREVFVGFFNRTFYPIGEPMLLDDVAMKYGQHLGKESFFEIVPNGWEG